MRTTAASLIVLALSLVTAPAWADRQVRDLAEFDSVKVTEGIALHLTQGDTFGVEVDAPADELDEIVTEVRGDTLVIHREPQQGWLAGFFGNGNTGGEVHVTLPRLEALDASSGSFVSSAGRISADSLEISASSGSNVMIDVAAESLDVDASSGASVVVVGTAREVRMESSSGSHLNARELMSDSAELKTSSGSHLDITVQSSLVARASSGSNITYRGSPGTVDVDKSSGGGIAHR